jgi:hypothetical protein
VAAETGIPGNRSDLLAARQKLGRGTLELQAQRELFRRLAEELAKGSMEVERRPAGTVGQPLQTSGSQDHILNDAQKFVSAHRDIIDAADSGA